MLGNYTNNSPYRCRFQRNLGFMCVCPGNEMFARVAKAVLKLELPVLSAVVGVNSRTANALGGVSSKMKNTKTITLSSNTATEGVCGDPDAEPAHARGRVERVYSHRQLMDPNRRHPSLRKTSQ